MPLLDLTIPIAPKPKQSARFAKGRVYIDNVVSNYGNALRFYISQSWHQEPITEPVEVVIAFSYEKPKSRRKQPAGTPKPSRPDLDNLAKPVLDAMNEIVIKDDALITSLKLYKRFEDANSIRIIISKEGEK